MPELTCFRLLDAESPAGPLAEAVRQLGAGEGPKSVYLIDAGSFGEVPNAPFAYWVEDKVRKIFSTTPALESTSRTARQGLATADNFRFLRCWWEVPVQKTGMPERRWWPFAKGGSYSPYYSDINQVVNWAHHGEELRAFKAAVIRNPDFYFKSGLSWPKRLHKLSTYVLPSDAIISDRGSGIFSEQAELGSLLALTNSAAFNYLAKVMLGRDAHPEFVNGIVGQLPTVILDQGDRLELSRLALEAARLQRNRARLSENSRFFVRPTKLELVNAQSSLTIEAEERERAALISSLAEIETKINQLVDRAYGMDGVTGYSSDESLTTATAKMYGTATLQSPAQRQFSYLFGRAIGRWSEDSATIEWGAVVPDDLFAALPLAAPGSMTAAPAKLYLTDDGMGDLVSVAISKQAANIFGERANQVELTLAQGLGADDLRSYLYKPSGFFADHLALYTDSPRLAPIYWPLSTKSGNFTLWVYYPKLDDQSLPKLIADVLSPKIRTLSQEIQNRRVTPGGKIGELEALRLELEEMRTDFLDLINRGYRPNQNDGVLITACPLAKYFRHAGFRKNLDACWKELARGDYDWSHLAMAMWPDRVLEVCKKDRSIAIAHGKEELCPAVPVKAARGRKKATD
jgi:hypothetical protein